MVHLVAKLLLMILKSGSSQLLSSEILSDNQTDISLSVKTFNLIEKPQLKVTLEPSLIKSSKKKKFKMKNHGSELNKNTS